MLCQWMKPLLNCSVLDSTYVSALTYATLDEIVSGQHFSEFLLRKLFIHWNKSPVIWTVVEWQRVKSAIIFLLLPNKALTLDGNQCRNGFSETKMFQRTSAFPCTGSPSSLFKHQNVNPKRSILLYVLKSKRQTLKPSKRKMPTCEDICFVHKVCR